MHHAPLSQTRLFVVGPSVLGNPIYLRFSERVGVDPRAARHLAPWPMNAQLYVALLTLRVFFATERVG